MSETLTARPVAAALCMVAAMMIIGVIDNFIAPLSVHMGLWQFHFVRAVLAAPLVVAMAWYGLGGLRPVRPGRVVFRSLLIAVSMLFYFTALAILPIAQALAGLFTSPIFILLISTLVLRRRIGPFRIGAVAIGFLGILLVLQPDPSNLDLRILIPVAAGFFYALAGLATRHMCAGESTVSLLAGMWLALGLMGLAGIAVTGALGGGDSFVTRGWTWDMGPAFWLVVVQAVGSVAGVFLIIKAYQLADPTHVGVFEYSVMIFGPLFAFLAFGQPVGGWQIIGTALIAASGIVIAIRAR